MGQLYGASRLHLAQPMMVEGLGRFVEAVKEIRTNSIELMSACRALEADIMGSSAALKFADFMTRTENV
jgi:hypothetical protein